MVNHKLAPLTESGALSAIAVVMALISVYVPVLGTVMAIIWPLPIIILSVRHGIRWGIMASIVSGVLIALLIEPMTAVRMVVAFAPVGLMLGFAYRKKYSAVKSLLSSVCVSIIAKSAVLLMVMFLMNINPLTMQVDMLKEAFEMSLDMLMLILLWLGEFCVVWVTKIYRHCLLLKNGVCPEYWFICMDFHWWVCTGVVRANSRFCIRFQLMRICWQPFWVLFRDWLSCNMQQTVINCQNSCEVL